MVKGTAQLVESVGKAGGDLAYYGVMHSDEKVAPEKLATAVTDIVLDGPQLALALDGAAGLGEGLAAGGLAEAETAAAVDRAYQVEPPAVAPAEATAGSDARLAQPVDATTPPKVGEVPSELAEATPANDNARPSSPASEGQGRAGGPNDVGGGGDDELPQLVKDQKGDMKAEARGETGLEPSGTEPLPNETFADGDEPGRIPELDSREPTRPDPERMQQGNDFDSAQQAAYPVNQLRLENGKILDSYVEGKEIVSRKQTQLAEINPAQAEGYVNEILDKYAPGNIIADSPANQARYPDLVGRPLAGDMILEVPVQQIPIPQEFGDWAARLGVTIRDFKGQVLNDMPHR